MLLLTGPTGSGKTATIRVLSEEICYEIQDYQTPLTTGYNKFNTDMDTGSCHI